MVLGVGDLAKRDRQPCRPGDATVGVGKECARPEESTRRELTLAGLQAVDPSTAVWCELTEPFRELPGHHGARAGGGPVRTVDESDVVGHGEAIEEPFEPPIVGGYG